MWFQRRLKTDNTLFDVILPVVFFVHFQSTKKYERFSGSSNQQRNMNVLVDHPMNIPTKFGSNWP
jgi:hypothetical protein